MTVTEFCLYISRYNINDISVNEYGILSNGKDEVDITNFNFNNLFRVPAFKQDLENNNIDSVMLITIIKAHIIASTKYDQHFQFYMLNNGVNAILDHDFLKPFAQEHLLIKRTYTYLNKDIKKTCDYLDSRRLNPITINDQVLADAYEKVAFDFNADSVEGHLSLLHDGKIYEQNDNSLGFISITAIVLIIINLGIIIASYIIRH